MTGFHENIGNLNLQTKDIVLSSGSTLTVASGTTVSTTLDGGVAHLYVPWDCNLVKVATTVDTDPGEAISLVVSDNGGTTCANITFASGVTGGIATAKSLGAANISNESFEEGHYITVDASDNNTNTNVDWSVTLVFEITGPF